MRKTFAQRLQIDGQSSFDYLKFVCTKLKIEKIYENRLASFSICLTSDPPSPPHSNFFQTLKFANYLLMGILF